MNVRLAGITAVTLLALTIAGPPAAHAAESQLGGDDQEFLQDAANAGRLEVALGHIAVGAANDPRVKEFGQRMVDDHTGANGQIEKLSLQHGAMLKQDEQRAEKEAKKPSTSRGDGSPDALDDDGRKVVERLSAAKGHDFDRAYMDQMVDDHEKAVKDFTKAAETATDASVKNFAAKTLPTLQEHLRLAKELSKVVKDGDGGGHPNVVTPSDLH